MDDPSTPERPDLDPEDILGVSVNITSEISYARTNPGPKRDPLAATDYAAHAIHRLLGVAPEAFLAVGWVTSPPDERDTVADVARRVIHAYVKYVDWMTRRFAPACTAGIDLQGAKGWLSQKDYKRMARGFAASWKGKLSAFYLKMLRHAAPAFGRKGIEDIRRAAASAGERSRSIIPVEDVIDLIFAAEDVRAAQQGARRRRVPAFLRVAESSGLQHVNEKSIRDYVGKLARAGKIGRPADRVDANDAGTPAPTTESAPTPDALAAQLRDAAVDEVDRAILRCKSEGMNNVDTAEAIVAQGVRLKFSDVSVGNRLNGMIGRAIREATDPDVANDLRQRAAAIA